MDGSDDYFSFEDIVLDDQTLAVLDSEEQKYLSQAPPPKRQRTDKGWKPAPVQSRATIDDNDLPEISVHGDGSYAFRGASKAEGSNTTLNPPTVPRRVATVAPQPHVQPRVTAASRGTPHTRPEPPPIVHPRVQPAPRRVVSAVPLQPPRPVVSDISQAQAEELRKQIEELRGRE
ncbi:hypothetical protein B0H14DRAFT_1261277 [Mycena olivaceomarginata]|nr:hypothetical protein B0H14DRAFT_1261277 [Mycena olivaceomarginata]